MVINNRIKRVLMENKAQYFGAVMMIIFSCFAFTLMTQFAGNFKRLSNEFESRYVQEDASFITGKKIDNLEEIEVLANAVIEEGKSFDYKFSKEKTLRIFSENNKVNIPAILEGKGLSERGDILISPAFASENNFKIGDKISISDKLFTITGFMALPNYIYPLQSETDMMPGAGFGIAVVSQEDFNIFQKGSSFYGVKFVNTDKKANVQSLEFRNLLKNNGINVLQWTNIEDNKRVNIVDAEINILNLVSKGVPTGILVLASIMVANIIWRLINREASIIGALYAIGYRRKEIYRHYLVFPMLIAIIGGIIGTIIGTFPVRSMVAFMFAYFNIPLTGIKFNSMVMILGILLPIIFLGCSGYFVIQKELKHSPVELMKGRKEKNKVNPFERMLRLDKFKFATKFKIREQLRSLSRLTFLLAGIVVATMLLQWGFSLKSSMDYLLSEGSVTSVYPFEYEYKFDNLRNKPLPSGAEPVSASLFLKPGDEKKDFYVCGIMPDSTMVTLADESGARLKTNQVIITKSLANQLKLKQGDTANIVRKIDGRIFTVKIDSIADTYAGKYIFMPLADYNKRFEMPEGSYTGAFSNVPLNIPENESYSVVTLEEKISGAKESMAPMQSMIGSLAAVAFAIGVIVIYAVTSLMVEENKNIISLMKIFGYRKKEINSLILNSSTIVVVIGYIIGIPLTLAAIGVLAKSLENSVGMSVPPMRIDLPYILIGFVIVMLSYELSKLMCKKKVNAVSMGEALKSGIE